MPDATQSTVTGLKWFKVRSQDYEFHVHRITYLSQIWQDGLNPTTHQWGSDILFTDGGFANFTIPTCIESGQYLLRVEAICTSFYVTFLGISNAYD